MGWNYPANPIILCHGLLYIVATIPGYLHCTSPEIMIAQGNHLPPQWIYLYTVVY